MFHNFNNLFLTISPTSLICKYNNPLLKRDRLDHLGMFSNMSELNDLIIIGADPAGLMAASTAAKAGLNVVVIKKQKDITNVTRTCSVQFVSDNGYTGEKIRLEDGKILLQHIPVHPYKLHFHMYSILCETYLP